MRAGGFGRHADQLRRREVLLSIADERERGLEQEGIELLPFDEDRWWQADDHESEPLG